MQNCLLRISRFWLALLFKEKLDKNDAIFALIIYKKHNKKASLEEKRRLELRSNQKIKINFNSNFLMSKEKGVKNKETFNCQF